MPDDSKNEVSQRKSARLARDAEKLLALSERLQEQIETMQRHMVNLTIVFVGLFTVGLVGGVCRRVPSSDQFCVAPRDSHRRFLLRRLSYRLAVRTAASWRSGGKSPRTMEAVFEIADLLRDVEGSIAKKVGRSMIERAGIRIRLSRLGIGTGLANNILGDDASHQSPAERQARQAGLLALKALNGQTLSENERSQLTPTVLAFLILQGKLIPTEYERSKLTIDELLLLACRGKVQLTPQEMNNMSEELRSDPAQGDSPTCAIDPGTRRECQFFRTPYGSKNELPPFPPALSTDRKTSVHPKNCLPLADLFGKDTG